MTPIPDRDHDVDLDDPLTPTIPAEQATPQHTTMVQFLPPVTSMHVPALDRQMCDLGFKLGEVLEDEYTKHPKTSILIEASQEDDAKELTTPRQQLVQCETPTDPHEPSRPPAVFHMETPDRRRARSAPPRAKSALRSKENREGSERPSRKVRIADIGDGFEQPWDRLTIPVHDDPYDSGDSTSKN